MIEIASPVGFFSFHNTTMSEPTGDDEIEIKIELKKLNRRWMPTSAGLLETPSEKYQNLIKVIAMQLHKHDIKVNQVIDINTDFITDFSGDDFTRFTVMKIVVNNEEQQECCVSTEPKLQLIQPVPYCYGYKFKETPFVSFTKEALELKKLICIIH